MSRRIGYLAAAVAAGAALAAPVVMADTPTEEQLRRGAELAETINCGQCHAATDVAYSGARVEDWYAPAINARSDARLPWTEAELYTFLRTGSSPLHGVAIGPMSELVRDELAALSDEDIEALAAYFAKLAEAPEQIPTEEVAAAMQPSFVRGSSERRGEWLFVGYCVSCHFNKPEAQTGRRPELALNTAVSAPDPSNLIRVMLRGVTEAEGDQDAYMPGFAMLLSDRDVADIAAYLHAAYAPMEQPWEDLQPRVAELRRLREPMR